MMRSRAARFTTLAQAKEFAEANQIVLNTCTYIGLEDCIDLDQAG